jgi:hypothetical protein
VPFYSGFFSATISDTWLKNLGSAEITGVVSDFAEFFESVNTPIFDFGNGVPGSQHLFRSSTSMYYVSFGPKFGDCRSGG